MKHNKNHDNGSSEGTALQPVRFEFSHPNATAVCVAGTFNNWQPEAKSLHPSGGGHWWKETALAPGIYEYCLVVDGKYIPDPMARETVPNLFGGKNSVLKVASSPVAAHLADAEKVPLKNAPKPKANKHESATASHPHSNGSIGEGAPGLMAATDLRGARPRPRRPVVTGFYSAPKADRRRI